MPDPNDYGTLAKNRYSRFSPQAKKAKPRDSWFRISGRCDCGDVSIGRLQRDNPLPPGIYWLDVIDVPNQQEFAAWRLEHSAKVRLISTEHFEAINWPDCTPLDFTTNSLCAPSRDWVKFEVAEPVVWDSVRFGFPNIISAGEKIETSADTTNEPDFSDNCDIGCQAEKVAIAGGVILGGVALIILLKGLKS